MATKASFSSRNKKGSFSKEPCFSAFVFWWFMNLVLQQTHSRRQSELDALEKILRA